MLLAILSAALFAVACCAVETNQRQHVVVGDDPVPKWPTQFYVEFNETATLGVKTSGKWWYDAVQNIEVIYRDNGKGDRYCGSVYPFKETPCRHVVIDGQRYLDFPHKSYCCKCCDADAGCGVLAPNWLDGAEYQGRAVVHDIITYKWMKKGLQSNYYYATADEVQTPVELDQWPTDYQFLVQETYEPGPVDPSVAELPPGCDDQCPIYSVCRVASMLRKK